MYTENSAVHDRTKRKIIKYLATPPPHIRRAVFALTLVVKAVDLRNLSRFVVASDEGDTFGVAYFQGEEEKEGLNRVEAPVNEVPCDMGGKVFQITGGDRHTRDLPMKR